MSDWIKIRGKVHKIIIVIENPAGVTSRSQSKHPVEDEDTLLAVFIRDGSHSLVPEWMKKSELSKLVCSSYLECCERA